jgi:hypothetical protein
MLGAFLERASFSPASWAGTLIVGTDDLRRSVARRGENRAQSPRPRRGVFRRPMTVRFARADGAPKPPEMMEDVRPMIDRAIAWF